MSAEARCRCCGVPVEGLRAKVRVCIGCDQCDGLHGDALQVKIVSSLVAGTVSPGWALARSMIDDAQMTGRTVYVECKDGTADLLIPDPPERWRVVVARALARNELPDVATVVDVILRRWLPAPFSAQLGENIRGDLLPALQIIDRDIMDVEIGCERDIADPEHMIIRISARTPALGTVMNMGEPAELPPDIMSRPRGSA